MGYDWSKLLSLAGGALAAAALIYYHWQPAKGRKGEAKAAEVKRAAEYILQTSTLDHADGHCIAQLCEKTGSPDDDGKDSDATTADEAATGAGTDADDADDTPKEKAAEASPVDDRDAGLQIPRLAVCEKRASSITPPLKISPRISLPLPPKISPRAMIASRSPGSPRIFVPGPPQAAPKSEYQTHLYSNCNLSNA